jgi:DNA-binding LacI/PurR family transcriptional regulator
MVTLKDIAQEAGVSMQLVSAVVNGKAEQLRISLTTRERVEETVKKMGYDPSNSRGARQMVARKHGVRIPNDVIAICSINDVVYSELPGEIASARINPYDNEIMAGIDVAAYKYGLNVLSCRHQGKELPRLIRNGEVDGVIPMGCSQAILEKLVELKVPMVQLVIPYDPGHFIGIANRQGIAELVRHLVELGHKKIAYIGYLVDKDVEGPKEYIVSSERFGSYLKTLQEAGLTAQYVDTSLDKDTLEISAAAVDALWQQSGGEITAIVCHNDTLAMGVIRRLQQLGVNVPGDVSVTGFDDISRQFAFEPQITSVYYDRFKLGQRGVDLLWQSRDPWLAGEKVVPVHEVLPVTLAVRQSTGPVRKKKAKAKAQSTVS